MAGSNGKLAVAVDVGGSFLKSGLVTDSGRIVERERRPIRKDTLDDFYNCISGLVERLVAAAGDAELIGIGIGLAGFLNRRTGRCEQSPNLHILDGAPVFADLERILPLPVALDNDANAAAWGEYWVGGGSGAELLVLLTLGSGIGGGIVWGGRIWHGAVGYAGELGHTLITPHGPPCNCGMRGCIEAEFSQSAFQKKIAQAIAGGVETSLAGLPAAERSAKAVIEAAAAGDELAARIVDDGAHKLGWSIANIINALNPDQVVLGGGIVAAADYFMPAILAGARERSIAGALQACSIRPSSLGNDAGLLGAAGLAWAQFGG